MDFNQTFSKPKPTSALMLEEIHKGPLSMIWRGTYYQRSVAIKIINKHNANMWKNEHDLFVTHKLRHENVVNFVCAERHFHENQLQYWIITEYHSNGSLVDYLSKNVLSKDVFLKMLYSIIKGLVYLHSGRDGKPMVAHRDLKSANILVKRDLSCCIGDLGLALVLPENFQVSCELCQVY